jgi:ubiquinol-cytochrome c reductase cytochrome b subunit
LDERIGIREIKQRLFDRKIPKGVGWLYVLGSASLFLLILQAATGILLAMNYSPSPGEAHASVRYIMENVPMGRIVRGLHVWGASFMVIVVTLHMLRVYFMGGYKYPRELSWIVGVLIWLVVLGFGFTGYLLPWDQKAYWATQVGTNIAAQAPVIGPALAKLLRGGDTLGAVTLTRFYAFHILVLPAVVAILVGIHLFLVVRQGISHPPERLFEKTIEGRTWREKAKTRYQELKEKGDSFFPYAIAKDVVAVFLLFLVVLGLALGRPPGLEEVADPTDSAFNPRPEWYFLSFFQTLKFFPGSLEAVAAVILPSLVILFLLLLPFIDRGPLRHPWNRPFLATAGLAAVGAFVVLTVMGWRSPLLNPVVVKDPKVVEGRRLYNDLRCFYCHSIQGRGGVAAPDLATVGARRDREWLTKHFQDPKSVSPGSIMPKLNLLPEEIDRLVAYMETLGGGGPFSPRASVLYEEHCLSCHLLDGKGGEVGPDLTAVRIYRDKAYLYGYIEDPKKLNPETTMPGFKGTLTDEEIEDLARYLLSTQRTVTNQTN